MSSPIRLFRIPLAVSSWLTFAIAFTFYWITADSGASYWDCPEYITVASKMEIGHPPGNPIWMLAMRAVTIPFPPELHAHVINIFSGLFMAFASFFLCRIIFLSTRLSFLRFKIKGDSQKRKKRLYSDLVSVFIAIGGSLCFALCDSVWFSAVEAEVYAMSIFLASLSLWLMILWWNERNPGKQTRLLILVAYLTGISLGVHQLNLLLLPVFALIVLYRKFGRRINPLYILTVVAATFLLVGMILMGFMPGMLYGAQSFELLAVNHLGLPYNSGVIVFYGLLMVIFLIALIFSYGQPWRGGRASNGFFPTFIWMILFLAIGFSSFGVLLIRAKAAPPMNEGNPDNIFALASYINREQYPSAPLIYGSTPYSRPMYKENFIDGKPDYSRFLLEKGKGIYKPMMTGALLNHRSGMLSLQDSLANQKIKERGDGYVLSDYKFNQMHTPELNMWFPRMTSRNINDREAYVAWGGMEEDEMEYLPISETMDSTGKFQPKMDFDRNRDVIYSYRPTYYQNLKYFVSYQAYYMYFRYLFWNFIGRQNDYPSHGEIEHGNFITGLPLIDNAMIGDTSLYPTEIWEGNKGRNRYFAIPFIFGIIGILWLACGGRKRRRVLTLVTLLFFMTGLAIVVYLNQSPGEPRERDYTFLGSYMAFSMWIAAGMICLARVLLKYLLGKTGVFFSSIIAFGPCALMAAENFDDHDRRNRYETTFYASSILDFEHPSIIFSYGDNFTFPIWYASEVLEMGKEHTPVDITYLSIPDYVVNLKKQGTKGVKTLVSTPAMAYGKFIFTRLPHDSVSKPLPIREALKKLYDSEKTTPEWPSSRIILPKNDKESVVVNLRDFTNGSSFLSFRHLMLLDILSSQLPESENNTPKLLYFPYTTDYSFYRPLESVLKPALFGEVYGFNLTDSLSGVMLKESVSRELGKLRNLNTRPHYIDPVIADRSVRYRGELVIAANQLLEKGDTIEVVNIIDAIENYYPYSDLLPGTFTINDTTYYEGKEYARLLSRLYDTTGDIKYKMAYESQDSLITSRREEWSRFYRSLDPTQRKTLSNRSKRLLLNN